MKNYPHWHCHSDASIYDGKDSPEKKAKRASELGLTHLAITDHGSMSNCIAHHRACEKYGIIPALGVEAYYTNDWQLSKEFGRQYKRYRRHMTLLAKSFVGYQTLCKLQTIASTQQRFAVPLIDYPLLQQHHEGIICLSGCVAGEIPYHLINNDMDKAKEWAENFLEIFGDDFYFELMPNDLDIQKIANEGLITLSQIYNRPAIMTNDAHFTDPKDLNSYILFRTMGKNEKDELVDQEANQEQIRKQYSELYICTSDRMNERWKEVMGTDGTRYLENTELVAAKIEKYDLIFPEEVPHYCEEVNGVREDAREILKIRATKALKEMDLWEEKYIARLEEELRIICLKESKADYYLFVADMCNFSRKNDVPLGPGRGSGVASLVAYVLGITQIDPLFFNLPFYRFMDEQRTTIPDFDIDHSNKKSKYGKVLSYLKNTYPGMTAPIASVVYYGGKNLVNDLGKALKMEKNEISFVNAVFSKMDFENFAPDKEKICAISEMQALEDQYKIITHYCSIHGNIKTFSEHASGIAITPNMIDEYVPLMVRGSGEEANISTAYKMTDLAEMGVCKVDILKVKYTDIVYQCVQQLSKHKTMDIFRTTSKIPPEEQQHYRPLETADIPLDDEETFKSYCDMNLGGTFQTDTYGGYKVTARVQPKSIFDLMDIMTLNRPTSLQLKQIDIYMDGKKGIVNSDDLLQKYCVRTGGALLYQEQIMECCHDLGNMSWNTAYKVMKHLEALPSDHPLTIEFVTGAMSHGIEKERAEKLFRSLTSYTFNMGHSAAYAVLAYWGMWLKIHFPHLFFLELLKENIGNKNYKQMEGDAIYNKLPVFLAHVNGEQNYHLFPYHNRKCIRQGLLIIDHVGPNAARIIQEEKEAYGPFVSEENFMLRMDIPGKKKIITSRVVEALKQYGALNFLTDDYVERTQKYNSSLLSTAKYQKARAKKNVKE